MTAPKEEPASTEGEQTAVASTIETASKKKPKAELLCFGSGLSSGGLQANFDRFRKAKKEEIKYRNYMAEQTAVDRRDPEFKRQLRQKFVDGYIKYFGVPYAKRYHNPGDPHYDAPLFLDCCAPERS